MPGMNGMRHSLLVFIGLPAFILFFPGWVGSTMGQLSTYSFSTGSSQFAPLAGATTAIISGGLVEDDEYYNGIPIGFPFYYNGDYFEYVSACANGWLTLGGDISTGSYLNNLTSSGTRPVIAPFWDDLIRNNGPQISYKTTGTPGSRVFAVQWLDFGWYSYPYFPMISFQVRLYEANGRVEFIYRSEINGPPVVSASIGITDWGTGSGQFLSLSDAGPSPVVSSVSESNGISVKPVTGQIFAFTPDPVSLSFSNRISTGFQANWKSIPATSFRLDVATDPNFNSFVPGFQDLTVGGGQSYDVTGLSAGSSYYYRVRGVSSFGTTVHSNTITVPPLASNSFRSIGSGDWSNLGIWQRYDGTGWVNPVSVPSGSNAESILVGPGHIVTVSADLTVDQLRVVGGGTLIHSGGTFTLADGTGTDFQLEGVFRSNGGTLIQASNSVLQVDSGAVYQHNRNGINLPLANWNASSTCEILGVTNSSLGVTNQTFGNFRWACPGQTGLIDLWTNGLPVVSGSFSVSSTGSGSLALTNNTVLVFSVGDDIVLEGGTLNLSRGNGSLALNLGGDFRMSGGTLTETGASQGTIAFQNTGTQNFVKSGGSISNTIHFTVNSGAWVDFGTSVLDGSSGNFTLSAGGGIITGHPEGLASSGLSGSIRVLGTRTYSQTGYYQYNGVVPQVTGNGLPASVRKFKISNTGGSTGVSLTNSLTVTGLISLAGGVLTTASNKVSVSQYGSLIRESGSSFVNGRLEKAIDPIYQDVPFEVGSLSGYSPLTLRFSGGTNTGGLITVFASPTDHPSLAGSSLNPILSINRYWTILNNGVTGFSTFRAGFQFPASDLDPGLSFTSLRAGNFSGSTWVYPVVDSASISFVSIGELTTFGDFQLAECGGSGLPGQPSPISGSVEPCVGSSQIYGVVNVAGVLYDWDFPSDWIQTGVSTTNSLTVTVGSVSGLVRVTPRSGCATGVPRELAVAPVSVPGLPSDIQGPQLSCPSQGLSYSLTPVGGVAYNWAFPAGWTQIAGGTGSSVTVTSSASEGLVAVTPSNQCGVGPEQYLPITVYPLPSVMAIAEPNYSCQGTPVSLVGASIPSSLSVTLLSENFDSDDNSWDPVNLSDQGTAAYSAWTLTPDGFVYDGLTFHSPDNSQFYLSNSHYQGVGGITETILQSPVMDASNFFSLTLEFQHYYRFSAIPDLARVQVSTNGVDWIEVVSFTATQGASASFSAVNINLDAHAGEPSLSVRFRYSGGYSYYWAIDQVRLVGEVFPYSYSWLGTPMGSAGLPSGASTLNSENDSIEVQPVGEVSYSVTSSFGGGCNANAQVTVLANPNAEFSYSSLAYCTNGTDPVPNYLNGGVSGEFSSGPGLVFVDPATGIIDLSGSVPGSYTVTNTVSPGGGCPVASISVPITIQGAPVAEMSYVGTPFCDNEANPLPTFSAGGLAGNFSASPGLVFSNPLSGEIDLMASPAGSYTVTNSIPASGACPMVNDTALVTILDAPNTSFSYSSPAFYMVQGPQPAVLTGVPGGVFSAVPAGLSVNSTTGLVTPGTSTPGTYTVYYSVGTTSCGVVSSSVELTIFAGNIIQVSGSNGADGSYGSLTNTGGAFAAINAGNQSGMAIEISIGSSSLNETGAISLLTGTWTSLVVYPLFSGIAISGINNNGPIINLDGADGVILDGRVNMAGSEPDMSISNSSTSSNLGVSTIRWINSACNNRVQYCVVKGSQTSTTSGVLFFSTDVSASGTGNDGNLVTLCKMTSQSGSRPANLIFSTGTLGRENSGNQIIDNVFSDFFHGGINSSAVLVSANSTDWTVSGNSFFETSVFSPTTTSTYHVIQVSAPTGSNFTISSNSIGGTQAGCGGSAWTKTASSNNIFRAISIQASNSDTSFISGNLIRNFSWANQGAALWAGIHVLAGRVDVGTLAPNIIGEDIGTSSLVFTGGATGAVLYGFLVESTGLVRCLNNSISGVLCGNSVSTAATNFYGFVKTNVTGNLILQGNTVGSDIVESSIHTSSASTGNAQVLVGIQNSGTGVITISQNFIGYLTNSTSNTNTATTGITMGITSSGGTLVIAQNSIRSLSNANRNTSANQNASVCGISVSGGSSLTLTENSVVSLTNSNSVFAGQVIGVFLSLGTGGNLVSRNFIQNLTVSGASSNAASIYGLKIAAGSSTYSNNIISLGGNSASTLYGFYETGANTTFNNLYFNTLCIGGAPPAGSSNKSYALFSAVSSNDRDFRSNIFFNSRSTTGGSNLHYAVYFDHNSNNRLILDYNDYKVSGTAGVLGFWAGANRTALPMVTAMDANSLVVDPQLPAPGLSESSGYLPQATNLAGISISGVLVDFDGNTRMGTPTMGALEGQLVLNLDVYQNGVFHSSYRSLKAAFDKINSGFHTGALELRIKANLAETATSVLYQSGYSGGGGLSSYSSVLIFPTVSGLSISGNIAGPLIDLNGAARVTFDGRVNLAGDTANLSLVNQSVSGVAGISTVRLINSASQDTIRYCRIFGSGTRTTSGTLFFSTATSGSGNDNNVFENNYLASWTAGRPFNTVYSAGSVGFENSGNVIRQNRFANFLNSSNASYGIHVAGNSDQFSIQGNSFFETSVFSPTANVAYSVIRVNNATGGQFVITGNYIGGQQAFCQGSAWSKAATGNNDFSGIYINVGTATNSTLQNNTIKNLNWANGGAAAWSGLYIAGGAVLVGTTGGNQIGDTTGTGSIQFTGGATGANFYGIQLAGTGTVECRNNRIGSIMAGNSTATSATNFTGIYKTATTGTVVIASNFIGSFSTLNSIRTSSLSTGAAQTLYGIRNLGTGVVTISGNTISRLSNESTNGVAATAGLINGIRSENGTNVISGNQIRFLTISNRNTAATQNAAVCGIALSGTSQKTVIGNVIYGLTNTYASFAGNVTGIYFIGNTGANEVSSNFIHSLGVTGISSAAASLYGIKAGSGSARYANNIILLGGNSSTTLYGIYETGAAGTSNSLYFNTVVISGSLGSGVSNQSFALYSAVSTNSRDFRNNLLVNRRSTVGGTGRHFSAYFGYGVNTSLVLDYNDYLATGVGGAAGFYNGAVRLTLPLVTGRDAGSVMTEPLFDQEGGTEAAHYKTTAALPGVPGTGITVDFGNQTRGSVPTMGAWELIIVNKWKGSISTAWSEPGNWTANAVPGPDSELIFDDNPLNHCLLDNDRSVSDVSIGQATYRLVANGHTLTIKGNLFLTNGGQLDGSQANSTLDFAGAVAQLVPAGAFYLNRLENLSIHNPGHLSIQGSFSLTGVVLAQTGNLVLTDTMTLVSGPLQTALISGQGAGEVLGQVKMQRYLSSAFGYRFIGSPFQNSLVGQLATELDLSADFPNLFAYNENRDTTSGWVGYANPADPLTPLHGFAANFGNQATPMTIEMEGVVSNGTIQRSLMNHNWPYTQGFNLVSNPYPSPIDWISGSGWNRVNIDDAIYYFNPGTVDRYVGTFSSYIAGFSSDGVASNVIPSMQGFFVHVSNGTFPVAGSLSLSNPVRMQTLNPAFHKSIDADSGSFIRITAGFAEVGWGADPAVLYFRDGSSSDFEPERDALKLMNTDPRVPNLYFPDPSGALLSISAETLPEDSLSAFPLGIKCAMSGQFEFAGIVGLDFPEDLRVYFSDSKTGWLRELKDSRYLVHLGAGDHSNRFSLILSKGELVPGLGGEATFRALYFQGRLGVVIKFPVSGPGQLSLKNLVGQTIKTCVLPGNGYFEMEPPIQSGMILVSYTSNGRTWTERIFIP